MLLLLLLIIVVAVVVRFLILSKLFSFVKITGVLGIGEDASELVVVVAAATICSGCFTTWKLDVMRQGVVGVGIGVTDLEWISFLLRFRGSG